MTWPMIYSWNFDFAEIIRKEFSKSQTINAENFLDFLAGQD